MKTPSTQTTPIPTEILREIESFEEEAAKVLSGELSLDMFRPFRLQHGIYGQRQPGVQMVRIKIPFGGLNSTQLRVIAEMADLYATSVGHVTTRQDIQLHYVSLEHVGTIMRRLAEVGVTTREACGNTVRNVTACHLAGVCQGEIFDVTPYAKAVSAHLLRNPLNQSLPRKFKIALSGCRHDCAMTPIHDLGFLAAKNPDGTIGFRVTAGGGLGSAPRLAHVLREFMPMDDLLATCDAIIKVFDNLGNRKNRNKARMKFVIEKLGFEEFKRRFEAEYAVIRKTYDGRSLNLPTILDSPPQLIQPVRSNGGNGSTKGNGGAGGNGHGETPYEMWRRTNMVPQKQAGFSTAFIRLPMGDITSSQMLAVADLIDEFSNGNIRTTIQQNLCVRWVPNEKVQGLHERLVAVNLGDPGAELVEDIIACPGTDTCGLGITSSKGLARALAEVFPAGKVPEDLRNESVKISGCHNSCAQHHISTIGLHGVGKRIGEHFAPHYELHLGGRIDGVPKIGQMTVKLPAKNVPSAVSHLLDFWRQNRREGERLLDFIERTGKARLKEELIPYTIVPTFEQDPSYYFDWEGEAEFIMEDLGPGECAGGALEMIENRILEAEQELYQARLLEGKEQHAAAVNKAYRAVLAAAKAVLVVEGIDPNTDAETFSEFERRFGTTGRIASDYVAPSAKIGDLGPKDTTAAFAAEKMAYAKGFVEACKVLTEDMSQELKMKDLNEKQATGECAMPIPSAPDSESSPKSVTTLDLRGVMCPINYVKTKLKLEMMDEGQILEVWLDAGDPIKNVPQSLRNDGQKVLSEVPADNFFKVTVEKVG
ncbi:MAG TPA: sulfurtransferase TusA family protein [Nitrospirales bacterium]|nr:sulfurtransferase TusA family protein [Nitrospirales bacterium]